MHRGEWTNGQCGAVQYLRLRRCARAEWTHIARMACARTARRRDPRLPTRPPRLPLALHSPCIGVRCTGPRTSRAQRSSWPARGRCAQCGSKFPVGARGMVSALRPVCAGRATGSEKVHGHADSCGHAQLLRASPLAAAAEAPVPTSGAQA
jgi:hypothetical protein